SGARHHQARVNFSSRRLFLELYQSRLRTSSRKTPAAYSAANRLSAAREALDDGHHIIHFDSPTRGRNFRASSLESPAAAERTRFFS
ncbi:MAG TPA: hypothetical protein VE715_16565, partial [Blastocatellia bacterium]|nr:hypothetical protein [Blastocatellia bacterium]